MLSTVHAARRDTSPGARTLNLGTGNELACFRISIYDIITMKLTRQRRTIKLALALPPTDKRKRDPHALALAPAADTSIAFDPNLAIIDHHLQRIS